MTQIINEECEVTDNLLKLIKKKNIDRVDLDYHIVSIIGCQSSGKSTLLNHLFNTKFDVMNDMNGRSQTTKGIHADFLKSNILVIDVEGSDSVERGDIDSLFEHKSALFSVALSEVVIVNLWEKDIGRHNASNFPLLKLVFEVNLKLFSSHSESKCNLLFLIRDSVQSDEAIRAQVRKDLESLWSKLSLPPTIQNTSFDNYFNFDFFRLPHFMLQRNEFDKEIKNLSDRFFNPKASNYLFGRSSSKLIPGDGLYDYIKSIWSIINENKDINLPSQRKALSNYRCKFYMEEALGKFKDFISSDIALTNESTEYIPRFGEKVSACRNKCISYYTAKTCKYINEVHVENLNNLDEYINQIAKNQFCLNNSIFQRNQVQQYKRELTAMSSEFNGGEFPYEKEALNLKSKKMDAVKDFIQSNSIKEYNWVYQADSLEKELTDILNEKLNNLCSEFELQKFQESQSQFLQDLRTELDKIDKNMWENIRGIIKKYNTETCELINEHFRRNTISRKCSDGMRERYLEAALNVVQSYSHCVFSKMETEFQNIFLKNEKGVSRDFSKESHIEELYDKARKEGLRVLELFSKCRLRGDDEIKPINDPYSKVLISPMSVQGIESQFSESIERDYYSAVSIREQTIRDNDVPTYIYFLIFLSFFKEMYIFVKNPISCVYPVILGVLLLFLYKANMLGKILSVSLKSLKISIELISKYISDDTKKVATKPKSIVDHEEIKKKKQNDELSFLFSTDQMREGKASVESKAIDS